MTNSDSKKICYYELLGVDRKCDAAEIKATYRKLALRMHPDKAHQNGMCPEEATKRFQQIQEAYSVLSDVQERAWYDAHREQILRGDDGPGEDPFKTKINLYKYFSVSCFDGFGDDPSGFFAVYRELFEAIDAEEEQWEDADEDHVAMPPFGGPDADWADVSAFYRHWLEFCSRKAFGHADQWNPKEAQNRQVRRAMEQENKKARQAAKKEFNAEVRQLVKFVQKRDPRVLARQKQQMKENIEKNQRDRAQKEKQKADQVKEREERKVAARQAEEERWAETKARKEEQRARGEVVSEEEDDSEDRDTDARLVLAVAVEYCCEPCRKTFKSEKAFDQHAKSKKHLQVVAKFRKELDEEMEEEAKNEDRSEESEDSLGHAEQFKPVEKASEGRKEPTPEAKTEEGNSSNESNSESDEDDFLLRFAAQKSKSAGRGYPAASPPATEEDRGGDGTDGEDGEDADAREEEPVNDVRSRRAQKRQQQTAAASQRRQERENVQDLVNGVKKAQRASKQEAKATDLTGPIPEGNSCGVCKEDFPSRSALFKHIKASGHALLKPAEPVAKGRKSKR
ncbi:unnamed protein product [Durusdinium trenchii]|uniref:Uncharacterized protein n=1 Tax=Durusdinium trenchii TaxID=1381693 RepID=A0ABP0I920_9DINO